MDYRSAALCNALRTPSRWTLLQIIFDAQGTKNVRELEVEMEVRGWKLEQPTISHHLNKLSVCGFINKRKVGLHAYYYVVPGPFAELSTTLATMAQQSTRQGVRT